MAAAAPRLGAGMIYGMIGPLARDDVAHVVHDMYALRWRRASSPTSGCWRCNRRAAACMACIHPAATRAATTAAISPPPHSQEPTPVALVTGLCARSQN